MDPHLRSEVLAWIEDDPDPRTAAELSDLLRGADGGQEADRAELADRFSGLLQFGTAGLRGALGGGPARMNRAVVARAAAGLAAFLTRALPGAAPRVVIGFDARYGSATFARDSAEIIAGAGGEVLLVQNHCPTPVLAYAVRALAADAGIMVTASHNPPQDNGYKVYLGGRVVTGAGQGAQIVAPLDEQIAADIARVERVGDLPRSDAYDLFGEELVEQYVQATLEITAGVDNPAPELRIVHTPMHGVGGEVLSRVLTQAGFTALTAVSEQFNPDPDFPTVAFPNPEEPGALDLAYATADRVDADLIIANDPDADRVSIAVPTATGWRQLSGDEVGVLLGADLAARLPDPGAAVFANSIVSSRLLGAIAARHGITHHETLTGFKWIARAPGITYGYEEAIGYCVHPSAVRDKDGISAALALAMLTARTRAAGRTLPDLLDDLALEYGLHATGPLSVRVEDMAQIPAAMARLRATPPQQLAGSTVTGAVDLSTGGDLPPTDALVYTTAEDDRVIVRPSGTEPKIKCYLEVILPLAGPAELPAARARAGDRLDQLRADIARAGGF